MFGPEAADVYVLYSGSRVVGIYPTLERAKDVAVQFAKQPQQWKRSEIDGRLEYSSDGGYRILLEHGQGTLKSGSAVYVLYSGSRAVGFYSTLERAKEVAAQFAKQPQQWKRSGTEGRLEYSSDGGFRILLEQPAPGPVG